MSAKYKLLQLRQYLSGDALKAIENLGHSAASYNMAILGNADVSYRVVECLHRIRSSSEFEANDSSVS